MAGGAVLSHLPWRTGVPQRSVDETEGFEAEEEMGGCEYGAGCLAGSNLPLQKVFRLKSDRTSLYCRVVTTS